MAVPQKPDCFVDQADADTKALEFLEGVAKLWTPQLPGVMIEHHAHVRSLPDAPSIDADGRTSFVWSHSGLRLLALAVVVRDGNNHSLLVTKQFQ